jgi:hypothetical protein
MLKKVVRSVVVGVVVSLCSPAFAQLAGDAAIAKTETILKSLQDGQPANVAKELDAKMAQALPEEKLQAAWPGLVGQFAESSFAPGRDEPDRWCRPNVPRARSAASAPRCHKSTWPNCRTLRDQGSISDFKMRHSLA